MQNRVFALIISLVVVQAFSLVTFAQSARPGGAAKPSAAVSSVDPHDLSGVWTKPRMTVARGLGDPDSNRWSNVVTNPPLLTPLGQAKFNANKPSYGPRAVPPATGNDPMGNCDPLGIPRSLFLEVSVFNMEIAQTPKRVFQFFEWAHAWREIWTDGRQLPVNPEPHWNGYSVGKWEGDTFVVDSVGFDDRTWIDHFGLPHSDALRLQERYRRADRDTLELTMTMTDPKIFTKPWVSEKKILKLVPSGEFMEVFCVPSEEQDFNKRVRDPAGLGTATR